MGQGLSQETWPYSAELELFPLGGMPKFNETAMLHHASKTLIVADLCFNHIHGRGFGYWMVFKMFGTYKRFAVSKMFAKMIKDQSQWKTSINKLMDADFEHVIMSHGENVYNDGKAKLQAALHERGLL